MSGRRGDGLLLAVLVSGLSSWRHRHRECGVVGRECAAPPACGDRRAGAHHLRAEPAYREVNSVPPDDLWRSCHSNVLRGCADNRRLRPPPGVGPRLTTTSMRRGKTDAAGLSSGCRWMTCSARSASAGSWPLALQPVTSGSLRWVWTAGDRWPRRVAARPGGLRSSSPAARRGDAAGSGVIGDQPGPARTVPAESYPTGDARWSPVLETSKSCPASGLP